MKNMKKKRVIMKDITITEILAYSLLLATTLSLTAGGVVWVWDKLKVEK